MFAWFLNLAYLALLAVVSPILLFRMTVRGKYRTGWGQKLLGRVPRRNQNRRCLWFHAVSVGEVLQLQPLLENISRSQPDLEVVISTTTPTGFDVAKKRYPTTPIFYFPLDFSWAVNSALARIKPSAIVLVELELWPNFIFAAAKHGIPVALVNGRISERSFRGYLRIRPLIRAMLRKIDVLAVQTEVYAQRLVALGADQASTIVTGSIKFDRIETDRDNPRTVELRRAFGLRETETVFIAGSTQDPEERFAIKSYRQLLSRFPDLRLILVPRHKERFDDVARLVEKEFGLPLLRRSRLLADLSTASHSLPSAICRGSQESVVDEPDDDCTSPPILLLDTIGELSACWGLATIAFVGGSLTGRGGQNMIEPAGYGAAVLFGPNTWNFKDVVELLLSQHAAQVVRTPEELTARLDELLADREAVAKIGSRAREIVTAQRGATQHTADLLARLLPSIQTSGPNHKSRAA